MRLTLERTYTCPTYTIGHLYIDGEYFCDTIEDTDRNLFDTMTEDEISSIKVYGETAIPCGIYEITMKVKSPKFSNSKYKWSQPYDGYIPRFIDVKGFTGILIHPMTTSKDSSGCVGVGENKVKGKVINSTITFNKLMDNYLLPADRNNEEIYIEIVQKYKK